jgi:hypothetical protein
MGTATTTVVAVLFVVPSDNLASLAPFEVIRVKERVSQDDNVHERGSKKMHDVAHEVLSALEVVAW